MEIRILHFYSDLMSLYGRERQNGPAPWKEKRRYTAFFLLSRSVSACFYFLFPISFRPSCSPLTG